MRGCGSGYFQAYELPDGQEMFEGSRCYEKPKLTGEKLQSFIDEALSVVERVPNFKNRFGKEGERIVLISLPDQFGTRARIFWYDGGNCFLYIEAPSLETALEFERANAYAF
jgi:hypothetical protein